MKMTRERRQAEAALSIFHDGDQGFIEGSVRVFRVAHSFTEGPTHLGEQFKPDVFRADVLHTLANNRALPVSRHHCHRSHRRIAAPLIRELVQDFKQRRSRLQYVRRPFRSCQNRMSASSGTIRLAFHPIKVCNFVNSSSGLLVHRGQSQGLLISVEADKLSNPVMQRCHIGWRSIILSFLGFLPLLFGLR